MAAAAAVALWLLLAKRAWPPALLALLAAAGVALSRLPVESKAGSPSDPMTSERPIAERANGYVSSDTCRACHPGQYSTWHDSYHRRMTQVVTPQTMLADWHGATLEVRGKTFKLTQKGDEYWVDMVDPGWRDDARSAAGKPTASKKQVRRVKTRALVATGSHHQQVFWYSATEDRKLYLLPFTWLVVEKRWVPYEHTFLRPNLATEQTEIWNAECIKCHSTAGRPRRDPVTKKLDTRVAEFGIACESCHGPAEEHVRLNRNPARRYALRLSGDDDPSILNPAKLDAKKSAEICGQCHSVSGMKTRSGKRDWWKDGFPYRPGAELRKHREIVQRPKDPNHPDLLDPTRRFGFDQIMWNDGAIRVSGREYTGLIESPCFAGGEFSCLSCHSMHQSEPNDQLRRDVSEDQACLQCHDSIGKDLGAHTHHGESSAGSRCNNCHMPHTRSGLFKAIRAHKIGSPSVRESTENRRPNACNLCHLDKTLAWTGEHLSKWYGQKTPALDPEWSTHAAGVLWLLRGDAGQRALVAWHMGWAPAQDASGREWMAPLLGTTLNDPYAAVRFIGARTLRGLLDADMFEYDYMAPAAERERELRWIAAIKAPTVGDNPEILFKGGAFDMEAADVIFSKRDNRIVDLAE